MKKILSQVSLLVCGALAIVGCGNSTGQRTPMKIEAMYSLAINEPDCRVRFVVVGDDLRAYRIGCDARGLARSMLFQKQIGQEVCIMVKDKDFVKMCE